MFALTGGACRPCFRNWHGLSSSSISVPFALQQVSILSKTDVTLTFWGGWQSIVCYVFLPFMSSSSIIYLLLRNLKFEFQNKFFLVNIKSYYWDSYYWDKNDEGSIKSGPSTKHKICVLQTADNPHTFVSSSKVVLYWNASYMAICKLAFNRFF